MKTTLSILLCKLVTALCKIFGPLFKKEGSVLPGRCILKWQKDVLETITYPKYVVVVTGSSGKGSTVQMVASILKASGKRVVFNKNGSNVLSAIVTLVLNNAGTLSHKVNADVLLLEMDERYIKQTFKPGTVTHMAITNITRDQPSRNINPAFIYNEIMKSVDKDMHLILNVDDPIVAKARYVHAGGVSTFGIAKTKYDLSESPTYAVDAAYCTSCHAKLEYSSYHYGHLGVYKCPNCSFARGRVDYEATKLDLEGGTFEVGGRELKLDKKAFYAAYYTLLSYAICDMLGVKKTDIAKTINNDEKTAKRGKIYSLDGRAFEMLESKNENALSYWQSLYYINRQKGQKTVVMGFENVSRRYSYNDLSWLWDVNFELLNDEEVDKIFLIGRFRYDVAVRLLYAGIDEDKLIFIDDIKTLISRIASESVGNIYTMVCFDMTATIRAMLKEERNEKSN